jgi:hypothetical protein
MGLDEVLLAPSQSTILMYRSSSYVERTYHGHRLSARVIGSTAENNESVQIR